MAHLTIGAYEIYEKKGDAQQHPVPVCYQRWYISPAFHACKYCIRERERVVQGIEYVDVGCGIAGSFIEYLARDLLFEYVSGGLGV